MAAPFHENFVIATVALLVSVAIDILADPGLGTPTQPAPASGGRASDPEHPVNLGGSGFTPGRTGQTQSSETSVVRDEFASADVEVASGVGVGGGPGTSDSFESSGSSASDFNSEAIVENGGTVGAIRDFQDTLIRSDRTSFVQTLVGEEGQRLPESWAIPPGNSPPGQHPGYRRVSEPLDYNQSTGVGYYEPPAFDQYRAVPSHTYSDAIYHPDGPYSYRYDGMVPLEEAGYNGSSYGNTGYYEDSSFDFEADFPLFTRQFDPNDAHLKAGPFYFEALWVETGVLYSDYHGPIVFRPGEEDGWLGYASFRFRMTAQLTPSLYISANGEVIYLFGENELGFRNGLGGGPFASIVYETQFGSWDFRAYAEFGTGSFYDAFGSDAYERAGRYSFGFLGRYDDGLLYDPFLYTRVGVEASTLVDPDWRLTLDADHTDYWHVGDDRGDDHRAREHLGALYGAEPNRVPFTPWFSYDLYSNDYFDTAYHTVYAGGSGRLSQNVYFDGRAGYLWTSDDLSRGDSWLWNIGLRHEINDRTTHGVRFGQDYFMNDYSIDSTVSNFFQYYIDHRVSDRLRLHAYAQWSNDEVLSGPFEGGVYERETIGLWVHYDLSDRLRASLGYLTEDRQNLRNGVDYDRSLFEARLDARIGQRSKAFLLYQHEDTDFFYEDVYMAGIRRYF